MMRLRVAGWCAAVLVAAACGGGGDGTGPGTPVFTSLAINPVHPSVSIGNSFQIQATPVDQNGAPLAGLGAASFSTSDQGKATVDGQGTVTGVASGDAVITATLTASGVTRTASTTVTVAPLSASAAVRAESNNVFEPSRVEVSAGGTVAWSFDGQHNVTFTGAAPAAGSIPTVTSGTVSRQFATPGSYPYTCTIHSGMNGTVVVR